MKLSTITFLIFLGFTFFLGMYLYSVGTLHLLNKAPEEESMQGSKGAIDTELSRTFIPCPDLLIKRGNTLLMYNTRSSLQEGKNPLLFPSMDKYIAYYKKQQESGVNCPQLFLQEEYDAQGNQVYRVRPSPFDLSAGLAPFAATGPTRNRNDPVEAQDASRDNPPYNQNMYAGFDPSNQYQGVYTHLDKIHDSTMYSSGGSPSSGSVNPADPNWVGVLGTQQAIDEGQFEENNVSIHIP